MTRRLTCTALLVAATLLAVRPAAGQDEPSFWSATASVTPRWESHSVMEDVFDLSSLDLAGSEFSLGLGRGRARSGDWGVSWVRKAIEDGTGFSNMFCSDVSGQERCNGTTYAADGAYWSGIEAHKFVPFGTIKGRAQIGMSFAGGVAWYRGTMIATHRADEVTFAGGAPVVVRRETTSVIDLEEAVKEVDFPAVFPLGKIELAAAGILSDSVKVRVSGGFDFPGTRTFSIRVVYFIGA
jgi:hypothetical protein